MNLRHTFCMAATLAMVSVLTGCHDGPLYALKYSNPYWVMRQWKADHEIGVTDHERWSEMKRLAASMESMSTPEQQKWSEHLNEIYTRDQSPEMRRLSILAAGKSKDPAMMTLITQAMDDESLKVRMEACRSLGYQSGEEPARLLATTLGKSQDRDVRHAAITALGRHPGPIANDALKLALKDRDPATQDLVIQSLRATTGKDYGTEPANWVAALDGQPVEETPRGGLRSFF